MWLVAKTLNQPLHEDLTDLSKYPHTISHCCRKQMQIDSFMELPKEKRPPKTIWNNPEELEGWFDRVFERKTTSNIELLIDEVE